MREDVLQTLRDNANAAPGNNEQCILDALRRREEQAAVATYKKNQEGTLMTKEDWSAMDKYKDTLVARMRDVKEAAEARLGMIELAEALVANVMERAGLH